MIAKSRGSESLTGAASLKSRMPANHAAFGTSENSSTVEQQLVELWVCGFDSRFSILSLD